MQLDLSFEQRARLELLAIHAGVSPAQLLTDALELLLERDAADAPRTADTLDRASCTQCFLSEFELETRFSRLLHS
jgi:hypothetical protein